MPRTPDRNRRFYPDRDQPVIDVLHSDGIWYRGRLHAWLREPAGWFAVATYYVAVGMQHYVYVSSDHVRPVPGAPGTGQTANLPATPSAEPTVRYNL